MSRRARRREPCLVPYTQEEFAAAYERAAVELQVPPPGPRGSINGKARQCMGTKVTTRARQLLYLARAARYTELEAAFDAGKGSADDAR